MEIRDDLTLKETGEAILRVSSILRDDVVPMMAEIMQAVVALSEILEEEGVISRGQQESVVAGMKYEAELSIKRNRQ